MLRRRGFRGGRGRSQAGRLADKLREAKDLGLREIRPLERPEGTPDDLDLARGLLRSERPVSIVASRRDGVDLIGWAHVAQALADSPGEDVLIAAPGFGAATHEAARRAAQRGLRLGLVVVPALAEDSRTSVVEEWYPMSGAAGGDAHGASDVLGRVIRVIEGALAVSAVGVLRRAGPGYVLYARGVRVARLVPESDGVSLSFLAPDKRQVLVSESNFPRWGPELHEIVIGLAQDPRLLGRSEEQAGRSAERAAQAARVRITAHWIPWNADGSAPCDWAGIDAEGRPVLGLVRPAIGLADVAAIVSGLERLRTEPGWTPGAHGEPRLVLVTERLEGRARALLERLGIAVESRAPEAAEPAEPAEPAEDGERRGRRRSRRRRGRRGDEPPAAREEGRGEERALVAERESEPEPAQAAPAEPPAKLADAEAADIEAERVRRLAREAPREFESSDEDVSDEQAEPARVASDESGAAKADGAGVLEDAEPDADAEAELAVAGAGDVQAEEESAEPEPPPERLRPRQRRPRAALCVRNDPDAILAALVLARDRRHITFFWVCSQADLMDFFRGRATDVDDNTDLLMVGFTAEPIPRETISTAELFRGRLQWFDAHEWPIEDVEALRDAIGEDSVVVSEKASSPLVAVREATERRSRFTDKMVDFSARRLGEHEMEKWGYRLVGLIQKLLQKRGDHRSAISPVLAGKPSDLPAADAVYLEEERWLMDHDPRIVHFGEYQLAVVQVPRDLDAGEVGRRARLRTGARLSLATREGDTYLILGANDEKRSINVLGVADRVDSSVEWAHSRPAGDRAARLQIDALPEHPERLDTVIGEIVKHKSVLYG